MASVLYQSIELLSQEKGIDPEIVVGAVEEAIALATRKFYKTQENMRGELNKETGQITAYIYTVSYTHLTLRAPTFCCASTRRQSKCSRATTPVGSLNSKS